MSHYGPPGEPPEQRPGPYGPPADPWGERPTEPWGGRPSEPWSDQVTRQQSFSPGSAAGPPAAGPPYGPAGGPDLPPGYGTGPDLPPGYGLLDEPRRRPIGLYAVVAVIVVLAAVGVGYALFLLSGDDGGQLDALPPATPDPTASPSTTGQADRDNIGMNAAMALVSDCLVNDGTANEPQMRIVPCDTDEEAQLYQVLEIFNERVEGEGQAANEQAQRICRDTEGYTHHYYEVGQTASFVLCMAEQE